MLQAWSALLKPKRKGDNCKMLLQVEWAIPLCIWFLIVWINTKTCLLEGMEWKSHDHISPCIWFTEKAGLPLNNTNLSIKNGPSFFCTFAKLISKVQLVSCHYLVLMSSCWSLVSVLVCWETKQYMHSTFLIRIFVGSFSKIHLYISTRFGWSRGMKGQQQHCGRGLSSNSSE